MHAAHSVVHRGHALAQVVGSGLELVHRGAIVEVGVGALVAHLVPALYGCDQPRRVDAGRLGDLLERVALEQRARVVAHLDLAGVVVEQLGLLNAGFVPQQVGAGASLRLDGVGDDVAAVKLLDKALALGVHQDAAVVQAHVVDVQERAGDGVAGGVGLNPLHAHQVDADCLGHLHAVARGAHSIGGMNALVQVGVVLHAHLDVGAEAARGQDERLAGELELLAVGVLRLHRGYGPVIVHDQLGCLHAGVDRDAGCLGVGLEGPGNLGAGLALGHQRALDGVAAKEAHVVPHDAMLVAQPLGRGQGTCGEDVDQVVVLVSVVTAADDVTLEELGRVLDAFLLLHGVARGRHAAARDLGVAADARQLLDHDDRLAGGRGSEGGGQTRAACADHDDVGVGDFGGLIGGRGVVGRLQRRSVETCLCQGVGDSGQDGRARDGGAGHVVDVERLVLHDGREEQLLDGLDHAGHLVVVADFDGGDLAIGDRHGHVDVSVLAARGGGVGAVLDGALGGGLHLRSGRSDRRDGQRGGAGGGALGEGTAREVGADGVGHGVSPFRNRCVRLSACSSKLSRGCGGAAG